MANWTQEPNTDPNRQPFKIHRVPANKPIRGVIISHAVIGTDLHYWKGRSVPCSTHSCPACQAGQSPRWRGYIQLCSADNHTIQIVEITERVWQIFQTNAAQHGSLRGLGIELRRINGRANGPLDATFDGIKKSDKELPTEADLTIILERMWEYRQTALPGCESEADPSSKPVLKLQA